MKTSMERKAERRKANEAKRILASLNRPAAKPKPAEPRKERQEIHCHNCGKYVQFDIDMSLNGQHVLNCPECGHLHYRVVENGIITADRWGRDPSQDIPTYSVYNITSSAAATYTSTGSTAASLYYYDSTGWGTSASTWG